VLAQFLIDLRVRAGLTQAAAAAGVGVGSTAVSNWERGATPSTVALARLLQVLDATDEEKVRAWDLIAAGQHDDETGEAA
jgi:transcriptional regulator with XRE-family HTH domain